MNVNRPELNQFQDLWIAAFNGRGDVPISSLVDRLISHISKKILIDQVPLENLKNLYNLMTLQVKDTRSLSDQTIIHSTVLGMLEGLILIVSSLSEAPQSTKRDSGFVQEVHRINEIIKEDNLDDAKEAFQQLSLKVLKHEIKIDPFVELSIVTPRYDEKLCNWVTSLCMLEKEMRYN